MSIANPDISASLDSDSCKDTCEKTWDLFIFLPQIIEDYLNLFVNSTTIKNSHVSFEIYFTCISDILQISVGALRSLSYVSVASELNDPDLFSISAKQSSFDQTKLYSAIYSDQRNVQDKIPSFLHKAQEDKRLVWNKGSRL